MRKLLIKDREEEGLFQLHSYGISTIECNGKDMTHTKAIVEHCETGKTEMVLPDLLIFKEKYNGRSRSKRS